MASAVRGNGRALEKAPYRCAHKSGKGSLEGASAIVGSSSATVICMNHPCWLCFRSRFVNPNPLSQCLVIRLDQPCRVSGNHAVIWETSCDYAVRSHYAVPTQIQLAFGAEYDAAITQPAIASDPDAPAFRYTLRIDRKVRVGVLMVVIHDQHLRSQQDVCLQFNVVLRRQCRPSTDLASIAQHQLWLEWPRVFNDIEPYSRGKKYSIAERNVLRSVSRKIA